MVVWEAADEEVDYPSSHPDGIGNQDDFRHPHMREVGGSQSPATCTRCTAGKTRPIARISLLVDAAVGQLHSAADCFGILGILQPDCSVRSHSQRRADYVHGPRRQPHPLRVSTAIHDPASLVQTITRPPKTAHRLRPDRVPSQARRNTRSLIRYELHTIRPVGEKL